MTILTDIDEYSQCVKYRKKLCDDINRLFATDINVNFTEAFTKGDDVNVKEGTDNDNSEGDSD